jgi:DNA helicase HerA-like ATPase
MNPKNHKPGEPIENLAIGTIIEVDGTHIVAELDAQIAELSRVYGGMVYPIGQFGSIIRIHYGRTLIYGYVSRLRMKSEYAQERGLAAINPSARVIEADLFGEGEWVHESGKWLLRFERGVSTFPLPQQKVYLTPKGELRYVYGEGGSAAIEIGEYVGSGGTPAYADMNELLGKHTALLGSTGAGKSGAVAAILHAILKRGGHMKYTNWNPRIVILDPHNEYGNAFPGHKRLSTDEGTLSLPYWLLDLNETIALLIGKTEYVATSQSNIVKNALLAAREKSLEKMQGISLSDITVDSPIPYVLGDPTNFDEFGKQTDGTLYSEGFVGAINAQRPDNKNKKDHEDYNKVLKKLQTLIKDSRLKFMMKPWDGTVDPLGNILGQFFDSDEKVRIVDLSGIPNEIAGTTSAAIARALFSVKLWQTPDERQNSPVLLICEEAHRYVPDRGEAQYATAQEAIRRLAKEGRKYGIGLMLISQRPSEVEATVLSQCNSWVVLRIANDKDREHVRSILPDSLAGLTKVLSGLRRREAIFVGQATLLPSRIMITKLDDRQLPKSHDIDFDKGWQNVPVTKEILNQIGKRWCLQQRDDSKDSK